MKIKREYALGLIGIATLLIFIWGVNFLKGKDLFQQQKKYYVVYPKVDGLIESHPVSVNGVKIGQVNKISFHPDRSGRVVVECIVGDLIDIPSNSVARLTPSSLMGGYEIEILLGNANEMIEKGDTLTGSIQAPIQDEIAMQLDPLKNQTEMIFSRMDTLLASLNGLFNSGTRNHIVSGIDDLSASMKNLETITANIQDNEQQINNIISRLSATTDTLASLDLQKLLGQTHASLESINQIMQTAHEGDGSVSLLLHDEQLYRNLESAAQQLEMLLEDVRNNPRKYFSFSVFGKQ